jgi:hypothetical protein
MKIGCKRPPAAPRIPDALIDISQFRAQFFLNVFAQGLDRRKKVGQDGSGFVHAGNGLIELISFGSGQLDFTPNVVDVIAQHIAFVDDVQQIFSLHAVSPSSSIMIFLRRPLAPGAIRFSDEAPLENPVGAAS